MTAAQDREALDRLVFRRAEHDHYILKRFKQALTEEREFLRTQLENPSNIETTTLHRGEVRLLKRILARLEEVGPESRQSELPVEPESAPPAPTAGGFPVSFENDDIRQR